MKILVTGMSGTGKSTALAALARLGHRVVDTDYGPWSSQDDSTQLWNEPAIDALLSGHSSGVLFVAGCVANQVRFYPRFDAVVLLSAPEDVILERVAARENNPFGKTEADRDRILADLRTVKPLLRSGATAEIDAARPLDEVVDELVVIAGTRDPRLRN